MTTLYFSSPFALSFYGLAWFWSSRWLYSELGIASRFEKVWTGYGGIMEKNPVLVFVDGLLFILTIVLLSLRRRAYYSAFCFQLISHIDCTHLGTLASRDCTGPSRSWQSAAQKIWQHTGTNNPVTLNAAVLYGSDCHFGRTRNHSSLFLAKIKKRLYSDEKFKNFYLIWK